MSGRKVTPAVVWRALRIVTAEYARVRLSRHRGQLASVALVVLGAAGALAGGAMVGRWAFGVVLAAMSGALLLIGLLRDDGQRPARRGVRTVGEILDTERQTYR